MAIRAFDVARRIDGVFRRVVYASCVEDRMGTEFVELGLYVFGGNRSGVAGEAVHLLVGEIEQPRFGSGSMRRVASLASVG